MKDNLNNSYSKHKAAILVTVLSLFLLLYFIICLYISPSGDDYSYAWTGANTKSLIQTLIGEWHYWNGRYLSNVLVLKNPIGFGSFTLYQAIPIVIISLLILTHFFVLKKVTNLSILKSILLSLPLITLFLNTIPEIGEGIYWYTASVTYVLSLVFFPIYAFYYCKGVPKSHHVILLILLQLLINGFNEIMMIMLCLIQAGSFLFKRFRDNKIYYLLLFTQITFASIVFFAPGNEVRGAYFPEKNNFFTTLTLGGAHTIRFTILLLLNPLLWVTIIIGFQLNTRNYFPKYNFPKSAWVLIFLLPQFIANAGPIWTTGILGQHRTVNLGVYFQLIVLLTFLCIQQENRITEFVNKLAKKTSLSITLTALIICLSMYGNSNQIIQDLTSGDAKKFKHQNTQRNQLLNSFSNLTDTIIEIRSFTVKPESIFIYDIEEDCQSWKNEVYTTYFNLKQKGVSIKKAEN